MAVYVHAGVVDFNFSKVQEASVPLSGTFQLQLSGANTSLVSYGSTTQEVLLQRLGMKGMKFMTVCLNLVE